MFVRNTVRTGFYGIGCVRSSVFLIPGVDGLGTGAVPIVVVGIGIGGFVDEDVPPLAPVLDHDHGIVVDTRIPSPFDGLVGHAEVVGKGRGPGHAVTAHERPQIGSHGVLGHVRSGSDSGHVDCRGKVIGPSPIRDRPLGICLAQIGTDGFDPNGLPLPVGIDDQPRALVGLTANGTEVRFPDPIRPRETVAFVFVVDPTGKDVRDVMTALGELPVGVRASGHDTSEGDPHGPPTASEQPRQFAGNVGLKRRTVVLRPHVGVLG